MSKQDEAFGEWYDEWNATDCRDYTIDRDPVRDGWNAAWDARGEHDAEELARKDELLGAYRQLVAAIHGSAAIKLDDACAKIEKLEKDNHEV